MNTRSIWRLSVNLAAVRLKRRGQEHGPHPRRGRRQRQPVRDAVPVRALNRRHVGRRECCVRRGGLGGGRKGGRDGRKGKGRATLCPAVHATREGVSAPQALEATSCFLLLKPPVWEAVPCFPSARLCTPSPPLPALGCAQTELLNLFFVKPQPNELSINYRGAPALRALSSRAPSPPRGTAAQWRTAAAAARARAGEGSALQARRCKLRRPQPPSQRPAPCSLCLSRSP